MFNASPATFALSHTSRIQIAVAARNTTRTRRSKGGRVVVGAVVM